MTRPVGFNGERQEGKAAKVLGMPALANPYQNEIDRLAKISKEPDGKLCEMASDLAFRVDLGASLIRLTSTKQRPAPVGFLLRIAYNVQIYPLTAIRGSV